MWSSGRPCKAPWNLTTTSPTADALWMPGAVSLWLLEELMTCLQSCWNLTFGLRYAKCMKLMYMCFATKMEMPKPGAETMGNFIRGKELLPQIHIKLQWKRARRNSPWNWSMEFLSFWWFYPTDYVMPRLKSLYAHNVIKENKSIYTIHV